MCRQILVHAKVQIGDERQETELTGINPLKTGRFALEGSVIEDEGGGGGGEEE